MKEGAHRTFSRTKGRCHLNYSYMCDSNSFNIRILDKGNIELMILVNKVIEWMIWSMTPMSKAQVSLSKAVLFAGLTINTECCILKHMESWKISQEIPERALGLMAELAECIATLDWDEKAWEFNMDISCWHYSEVKGKKLLFCCTVSDQHWSLQHWPD